MIKVLLILALEVAAVCCVDRFISIPRLLFSAATPSQIRVATEMNYDNTGPGARNPKSNQAYRVYKNLDEALIAYIDDPDTKLPDHEKAKVVEALNGLQSSNTFLDYSDPYNLVYNAQYNPHTIVNDKQTNLNANRHGDKDFGVLRNLPTYKSPFRWQKLREIWPNPLSLKHYTRESLKIFEKEQDKATAGLSHVTQKYIPAKAHTTPFTTTTQSHAATHLTSKAPHRNVPSVTEHRPLLQIPYERTGAFLSIPYRGHYTYWDKNGRVHVQYKDDEYLKLNRNYHHY